MAKYITNLNITDDTLRKVITKHIIDCKEKEDIVNLILFCIAESSVVSAKLINVTLGVPLQKAPKIGTEGFIPLTKLGYSIDKETYRNSPFFTNGYIPCVVTSFSGHHRYCPLEVRLPILAPDADIVHSSIELEDFHIVPEDLDILTELPF